MYGINQTFSSSIFLLWHVYLKFKKQQLQTIQYKIKYYHLWQLIALVALFWTVRKLLHIQSISKYYFSFHCMNKLCLTNTCIYLLKKESMKWTKLSNLSSMLVWCTDMVKFAKITKFGNQWDLQFVKHVIWTLLISVLDFPFNWYA